MTEHRFRLFSCAACGWRSWAADDERDPQHECPETDTLPLVRIDVLKPEWMPLRRAAA